MLQRRERVAWGLKVVQRQTMIAQGRVALERLVAILLGSLAFLSLMVPVAGAIERTPSSGNLYSDEVSVMAHESGSLESSNEAPGGLSLATTDGNSSLDRSSSSPQSPNSQGPTTGWIEKDGARYYLLDDGLPSTGWLKHEASWFYFGSDGAMATGWVRVGNYWYYLNDDGRMATGWKDSDGARYYLNLNGDMALGWIKLGGYWYYLNPAAGGVMATGWANVNNTWYYLESDGRMATGWKLLGDTWYYLYPSGAMATGWINTGGTWYYLHPSGAMATGWINTGGAWYYLHPSGAWQETGPGGKCAVINDGRSIYPTGDASRVYLVTASSYRTSYATFVSCTRQSDGSYDEAWSTSARIGLDGFNTPAQTLNGNYNDMKTPTGSFGFVSAFGVQDPGTLLSYRTLNSRSKWSGNRSWNYNRYYEATTLSSYYDENMWHFAKQGDYRQGIVLDYNYANPNPALNYAIFLHANKVATAGCVALDEAEVTRVLKEAPSDARIIMGVASEVTR